MTPKKQLEQLLQIQKALAALKEKPKTIIIDDDENDVELMKLRFKENGIDCATASHGELALSKIEAGKFWVVFLDWNLLGMSGLQTLQAIKALPVENTVIVVTGLPCQSIISEALSNGAAAVISKPLENELIIKLFGSATP